MSGRGRDRYRRVRAALRKVRRFRMKGRVALEFVNRVKGACFLPGRAS